MVIIAAVRFVVVRWIHRGRGTPFIACRSLKLRPQRSLGGTQRYCQAKRSVRYTIELSLN